MENTKQLVHEFIAAGKLHHRAIENAVRGMKIHHRGHRLLVYLAHCEVMPSQKEIADRFEISPAAVANSLKKLEKDGYITRRIDDGDTRCNRIAITEKGKTILDETKTLFESVDERMLEGLSHEERSLLFSCLSRMKQNLASLCEENKEDER